MSKLSEGIMTSCCPEVPNCPCAYGSRFAAYVAHRTLYTVQIQAIVCVIEELGVHDYNARAAYIPRSVAGLHHLSTRMTALRGYLGQSSGTHNDNVFLESQQRHKGCQSSRSTASAKQLRHATRNRSASVARHAVPERQQELEAFLPEVSRCQIDDVPQTEPS